MAQEEATIPVAGHIDNTNTNLGQHGINGIKTGHTDESGGCLLFSVTRQVGNKSVTLVGAVQAMPTLDDALQAAPDLVDHSFDNFVYVAGPEPGKSVGTMAAPWAPPVQVVAKQVISQVVWSGTPLKQEVTAKPAVSGQIGQVKVGDASTLLSLESGIPPPSIWWRLTHPLHIVKGVLSGG